jgi:hypothetical protein
MELKILDETDARVGQILDRTIALLDAKFYPFFARQNPALLGVVVQMYGDEIANAEGLPK